MYCLRLLDGVSVEGPAGPVSGRAVQRRQLALLALLGAAGDTGLSRDRLIGHLWPESDEARARHLLRDSLYHLRRELGEDAVLSSGESVRLNPDVVWCDVSAFRGALEQGALEEAVSHYRGPFLHGFHLRGVPEYERWSDTERQRLGAQNEEALESLARAAESARDYPQAVGWWRRLCGHDRYNSRFVVSLMEALALTGDPANALRLAAEHEAMLREELGTEAASHFRVLADQVELTGFSAAAIAERPAEARGEEARTVPSETVVATSPAARSPLRKPALSVAAVTLAVIASAVLWLNRTPPGPALRARFTQLTFSGKVLRAEISPDGELLAYVEEGKPRRLLVRDLTGERAIEIANIESHFTLRWSPDGSSLLFAGTDSTGRLVAATYPRLGGTPGSLNWSPFSAWSPDGSRVAGWRQAMSSGVNPIVVTTLATGDTSLISTPDSIGFLYSGDWSPDGRFIALLSTEREGDRSTLWTAAVDGSGWRLLARDTVALSPPRWSPSDAVYYFRTGRFDFSGNELRKIRVTPEGERLGDPEVLQVGLEANISPISSGGPSLSADGRKLVFVKQQFHSNLWSLLAVDKPEAGSRVTAVQLTRGTSFKSDPSLSPDGAWIAFTQYRQDRGDIYVIPAGGGSPRRVTSSGRAASAPAWSGDGRTLAYLAHHQGAKKVRTVSLQGNGERTYEETHAAGELTWAPGERILYQRPGIRNFHLLDPSSEAEEPLVANDSVGWMHVPRYSPTADRVAVSWVRGPWGGRAGIYVVSLHDSSQSLLLPFEHTLMGVPIGWSADGGSVYVSELDSGDIVRVPVTGGEATVVATLPFEMYGPPGLWFLCTATEGEAGLTLVCAVPETMSDAWMIENFHPDNA